MAGKPALWTEKGVLWFESLCPEFTLEMKFLCASIKRLGPPVTNPEANTFTEKNDGELTQAGGGARSERTLGRPSPDWRAGARPLPQSCPPGWVCAGGAAGAGGSWTSQQVRCRPGLSLRWALGLRLRTESGWGKRGGLGWEVGPWILLRVRVGTTEKWAGA